MLNNQSAATLVRCANGGDESAWHGIIRRYTPLVRSVCQRHGLDATAAEDVGGTVWLRLVDGLRTIREPAALPGWLATITRRECLLQLRQRKREFPTDDLELDGASEATTDSRLLAEERSSALREALAGLPDRDRRLLSMLFADPPASYAEISATLGMPVGAIGPTRRRCLNRMRSSPALAELLNTRLHSGR